MEKQNTRLSRPNEALTAKEHYLGAGNQQERPYGPSSQDSKKQKKQANTTVGMSAVSQSRTDFLAKGDLQGQCQRLGNSERIDFSSQAPRGDPKANTIKTCWDDRVQAVTRFSKYQTQETHFIRKHQDKNMEKYASSPGNRGNARAAKTAGQGAAADNFSAAAILNIDQEKQQLIEEQQKLDEEQEEKNKQSKKHLKKHDFLRKGEKTRSVYDPQRALMQEKLTGRNRSSVVTSTRHSMSVTPKATSAANPPFKSRQQHAGKTPPPTSHDRRVAGEQISLQLDGPPDQYQAQNGPRTPQSRGGHM